MDNPEHIKWLLEGVEAWNERRRRYPFAPMLNGVNLYEEFKNAGKLGPTGRIPLAGANLSRADLKFANLDEANLGNANLSKANLNGARLNGAYLNSANLDNANLSDAKLDNAKLEHASLSCADLRHTSLIGANLHNVKLWKAILYSPEESLRPYAKEKSSVETIGELLGMIRNISKAYNSHTEEVQLYFRGESKCGWSLCPSVMREGFGKYESKMLVDLASQQPEEFDGMTSTLAQWVLAQHHGLRTRFLDVTKNPLVALFNTCRDDTKGSGRLHVFAVPPALVKAFNSDTVSVIANFAKLSQYEQGLLLGKCARSTPDSLRYPEAMNRLYQLIHQEKPYFAERINIRDLYQVFVVEPQQSHERIRAQAGAFLASAFHLRFERDEILKWNADIPVYDHYKLTVPGERKTDILEELRLLNITREALFPGLDSSAQAITELYKQRVVGDQNE